MRFVNNTAKKMTSAWPVKLLVLFAVSIADAHAEEPLYGSRRYIEGPLAPHRTADEARRDVLDKSTRFATPEEAALRKEEERKFYARMYRMLRQAGATAAPAPVTDDQPPAPLSRAFDYFPRMTKNYWAGGESGFPPDPHCAAGPAHVVTIVNFRIDVFTKDGTNVYQNGLNNFFRLTTEPGAFDPKVVYDEDSQRFFAMAIGFTDACAGDSYFYLAVSKSSDPSDDDEWWRYILPNDWDGEATDYPSLGVGDRAVYLGANYPWCGNHFNTLYVLDKASLVSGAGWFGWAYEDYVDETGNNPGTTRPTVTFGVPSGGDAYILGLSTVVGSTLKATLWRVELPPGFPTDPPAFSRSSVAIPDPGALTRAEQQGGPGLITTWNCGSPPFEAVYQNNRVWSCSHYGSDDDPDDPDLRTILRSFEFDISGWPSVSLASTQSYWDGTSYYYWPGITANHHGDVAMVFSRSSDSEYAGVRWAVRPGDEEAFFPSSYLASGETYYGDPVNDWLRTCDGGSQHGQPCDLHHGDDDCPGGICQPRVFRWGDYAGIAVDPVDHGFWVFHEYAVPRGDGTGTWAVRLGYIPRAVYVDSVYGGSEAGTRSRPWDTVTEGHAAALPGNDLVIRAGAYAETVTLDKAVTVIADGGTVTIGW